MHDGAIRPSGKFDRRDHAGHIAADQCEVAGLDGDVGAGANGNAKIGLNERWCVVDAVANHRNNFASFLEPLHLVLFVLWEHFGNDSVDADRIGNRLCSTSVVARDHRHGQLELVEPFHGVDG